MVKFEESNFYKALQDFFINADKKTFLQFLAEFYNRTEGIIDKDNIQDDLIKELRKLYLELNEKGIDDNIVREKVNYFLENSLKIKDIISKLTTNTNNIENINSQMDTNISRIDNNIRRIDNNIKSNTNTKNLFIVANNLDSTGVIDVTNELQNLLNNYNTVMLPSGTYKVSKILLRNNNYLYGENKDTVIITSNTSGFAIETLDKNYNIKIETFTLNCNSISSGVHFKCTNNENMEQFDIKNSIINVNINNSKGEALLLDGSCRECRVTDVSCYYCDKGIIIKGTDNFINNCTTGNINSTGFLFNSNNKANCIKAFLCNKTDGESAIEVTGYGVNISNCCVQQNYKNGISINGTSCYVDVVSDSQGYDNKFNACGVVVKGSNNIIRGSIIDGRLDSALSCGLYVNKNAFLNDINVTFMTVNGKKYNKVCVPYKSDIKLNLNNITLNGEKINSITDINFRYFADITENNSPNFKKDATGNYTINGKDIEITLSNFENISNGWGNSFRIFPNTENKKYLIVYTTVYYESDTSKNIIKASIMNAKRGGSPFDTYVIAGVRTSTAINSYRDLFMIIDYEEQKINSEDYAALWLCLMKNTTETVSCNGKAIFKSPRFYFSD